MGGFGFLIAKPKKDIQNLCEALDEFAIYVKATFPFDPTGLTHYNRFKNENDVVWLDAQGRPIRRVKDQFPEHLEDLKNGNEILYWFEVTWLRRIPLHLIARLRESLEKHNCEWFWNKLAQESAAISNLCDSELERIFKESGWSVKPLAEW